MACSAPSQPAAPRGSDPASAGDPLPKRLVAAIRGVPTVLNYSLNRTGAGGTSGLSELDILVNPGLSSPDKQGALQPRMAEAVPTVENGFWKLLPDGRMETTWHIVHSARWDDGVRFTSCDLVFVAVMYH